MSVMIMRVRHIILKCRCSQQVKLYQHQTFKSLITDLLVFAADVCVWPVGGAADPQQGSGTHPNLVTVDSVRFSVGFNTCLFIHCDTYWVDRSSLSSQTITCFIVHATLSYIRPHMEIFTWMQINIF